MCNSLEFLVNIKVKEEQITAGGSLVAFAVRDSLVVESLAAEDSLVAFVADSPPYLD